MKSLLVFIPTLNESGTIKVLLEQVHHMNPTADLLVVDDNSIDGTQEILRELTSKLPLKVITRPMKMGIGTAHIQALNIAKSGGYKLMISMDADGAHDPIFIPEFLDAMHKMDASLVVGSRYMRIDSLNEWSKFRKLLTHFVHLITRILLGLKYDTSSGFRCYKMQDLPPIILSGLKSTGYDFFFESMYEMNSSKLKIREVSIVLPARTYGHSKMTIGLALSALRTLIIVSLRRIKRARTESEKQ